MRRDHRVMYCYRFDAPIHYETSNNLLDGIIMDINKICALGRSVVDIETEMIKQLVGRIDHKFANACQMLQDCQGRIAVTGVGKSGHIGKKIAATFASTGSPSFFMHPGEAKHGDIGMLTAKDIVIALSNSGESEEIISILPFIKRLNIPLIALTGKPHSKLASFASVNLDVSVEKEACPLGLAPTSSTTATLVMGDALAMTLLELRGFNKNDFALSHPGGTLGKRLLLKVEEIMHKRNEVPIINQKASLKSALLEMTQKKLGMTTVVDDDNLLVGIFTDGDLRRTFESAVNIESINIRTVMTKHPKTISRNLLAADALNLMETHKITSLIIIDDHQSPEGIIHIHDILRAGVI